MSGTLLVAAPGPSLLVPFDVPGGRGAEVSNSATRFLITFFWRIIAEFTEIESGKRSDRPALEKALAAARVHQAPLVVAKVDRLTRNVGFLCRLLDAGVEVRFVDLPMIEGPIGTFMLQQMVAVAQLEAGLISARTKAALAAAKRRGVKLGGDRGARLTAKARAAGTAAVRERARSRALDLIPTVKELQAAGHTSLRAIAAGLEERGIPTARGGKWSSVQVMRLLEAATGPFVVGASGAAA